MNEEQQQRAGKTSRFQRRRFQWGLLLFAVGAITFGVCLSLARWQDRFAVRWFGPSRVASVETYEGTTTTVGIDHRVFDRLLREHVDGEGFVDYEGMRQQQDELATYIEMLAQVDLDALGRDDRLATLINAYNAFTIRLILDYPSVASIKEIPTRKRWADRRWSLGGERVSLEQIEHEMIRPNFVQPEIHFALVCAAVGCPPLRKEAYNGERLLDQLKAQAEYVHANRTWLTLDSTNRRVELTRLYLWYEGDFLQDSSSVVDFASRYSPPLVEARKHASEELRVDWLRYDWSLNGIENRQQR